MLALAPSNVAVDNLVERLGARHKRIVRIGHPARLLPHIAPFALDAMVAANEQTSLAADARRDLNNLLVGVQCLGHYDPAAGPQKFKTLCAVNASMILMTVTVSVWVKMMVIVAISIVCIHKDVLFTPVTHIHLANILSSSGHKSSVAQPKADECLSSASHCPPFSCSLCV